MPGSGPDTLVLGVPKRLVGLDHGLAPLAEDLDLQLRARISQIQRGDPGGLLSDPALWAGMFVAGLFLTAAIYLRRYRDDS